MGTHKKVFISATRQDLDKYCAAAIEECNRLQLVPIDMQYFEAMSAGATEGSLKKVEEADAFVGIYAHRYGYIPAGHEKSITELEYDFASEKGIERLCFLVDPRYPWPPDSIDHENYGRLTAFKNRIEKTHIRGTFTTIDSFKLLLNSTLSAWKGSKIPQREASPQKWELPSGKPDFTGRETEVRTIIGAVETKASRVFVICGLPGTGKTELGLHVAEALRDHFAHGAIFCDLRGFKETPLRAADAARQVLLSLVPGIQIPSDDDQVFRHYYSAFSGKRVLLFLDDAQDATHVERLLPPSPSVVLITSRRNIDLPGAVRLHLESFSEREACDFLRKIGGRVTGSEERVADACGRLPLALRLAAAALEKRPAMELGKYLQLLTEASGRSRYLPALQVQFDLLTKSNQPRLAALTLFRGGFTVEGACAVWGLEEAAADEILVDLYDLSLIVWNPGSRRFGLHDLVRQIAQDVLERNPDPHVAPRYAAYILASAEAMTGDFLRGSDGVTAALATFDENSMDIDAVLSWAEDNAANDARAAAIGADLANCCWYLHEHRRGLGGLLKLAVTGVLLSRVVKDLSREMVHLRRLGFVQVYLDPGAASETLARPLKYARDGHDRRSEGIVVGYLGLAYENLGRIEEAIQALRESLAIANELDDKRQTGIALGRLANIHERRSSLEEARRYYDQALGVEKSIGDEPGIAIDSVNCGRVCEATGLLDDAARYYEEAAAVARRIGSMHELEALACLCELQGADPARAEGKNYAERFRAALMLSAEKGASYLPGRCSSLIAREKWSAASVVADCMIEHNASEVSGWTEKAYAVRRMPHGGLGPASEVLAEARKRFPTAWIIPYNLACYSAQSGLPEEALTWLREAATTAGDREKIKSRALGDDDFSALREKIAEL